MVLLCGEVSINSTSEEVRRYHSGDYRRRSLPVSINSTSEEVRRVSSHRRRQWPLSFPLIQLPKKLEALPDQVFGWEIKGGFPLIQLPKKLEAVASVFVGLGFLGFPLIQLPKKLEAFFR